MSVYIPLHLHKHPWITLQNLPGIYSMPIYFFLFVSSSPIICRGFFPFAIFCFNQNGVSMIKKARKILVTRGWFLEKVCLYQRRNFVPILATLTSFPLLTYYSGGQNHCALLVEESRLVSHCKCLKWPASAGVATGGDHGVGRIWILFKVIFQFV
jgi:hypothetical protein